LRNTPRQLVTPGAGPVGRDQVWGVKAQQQIGIEVMLGVGYTANLNDFLKRRLGVGFGKADATLQFRDTSTLDSTGRIARPLTAEAHSLGTASQSDALLEALQ
jgi:hypothetical protein